MILNNRINGATGTFFNALVAVRTPRFIFYDLEKTYLFKKPGNESCWAEKVAKWPVGDETCQNDDCCNHDAVSIQPPVEQFKRIKEIVDIGSE